MYISLNENKNQYYGQCCCFLELKMYLSDTKDLSSTTLLPIFCSIQDNLY